MTHETSVSLVLKLLSFRQNGNFLSDVLAIVAQVGARCGAWKQPLGPMEEDAVDDRSFRSDLEDDAAEGASRAPLRPRSAAAAPHRISAKFSTLQQALRNFEKFNLTPGNAHQHRRKK